MAAVGMHPPLTSYGKSFSGRDGGRGSSRGGRFGGRGDGGKEQGGGHDEGPPAEAISTFLHPCKYDAVTKITNEKIPYFNAPIYLCYKTQIGKVDEIFGPTNDVYFSIKMLEGIIATSYSVGNKFYIDPAKLLPLARFLPKRDEAASRGGRVGGRGGGRGGRGGGFRGRGGHRGGGRRGPPRAGGRSDFRGRGRL